MPNIVSKLVFPSKLMSVGQFYPARGKGFIKVGDISSGSYLRAQFLRTIGLAKSKPRVVYSVTEVVKPGPSTAPKYVYIGDQSSLWLKMMMGWPKLRSCPALTRKVVSTKTEKSENPKWSYKMECKSYGDKVFKYRVTTYDPQGNETYLQITSKHRVAIKGSYLEGTDKLRLKFSAIPIQENSSSDKAKGASVEKGGGKWKSLLGFFRFTSRSNKRHQEAVPSGERSAAETGPDESVVNKELFSPFFNRESDVIIDGNKVAVTHWKLDEKLFEIAKNEFVIPKDKPYVLVDGVKVPVPAGATRVKDRYSEITFYSLHNPEPIPASIRTKKAATI